MGGRRAVADGGSLPAVLRDRARRAGGAEAISDGPVRLSYADFYAAAREFGRAAMAHGLGPGDRAAVWASNGHRWLVAAAGILGTGAVLVPLNTRYRGPEAHDVLRRAGVKLLVVEDGFLGHGYVDMLRRASPEDLGGRLVPGLPALADVVTYGSSPDPSLPDWSAFLRRAAETPPAAFERAVDAVDPGQVAEIVFTSGTTGRPKGVMLRHGQSIRLYRAWGDAVGLGPDDRVLVLMPLFHTAGYKSGFVASVVHGATMVPQAVHEAGRTLRLLSEERVTATNLPPTVLLELLDHPDRASVDLGALRVVVTGATIVPVALVRRLRSELSVEHVLTGYGLTESCGTATMCRLGDTLDVVATRCGRAVDGTEVGVMGPSGALVAAGEPGEVVVRGYNLMAGYLDDQAATAAAIDPAGWLHTGDVGVLDELGYLRITDRLKDMIIVGGFNVYPAEIEQALFAHGQVAEAAVIGVPDDRLGEVGRAFVVPASGAALTEAELAAYCRERLANFKVPRTFRIVASLPKTPTGKVAKSELRRRNG